MLLFHCFFPALSKEARDAAIVQWREAQGYRAITTVQHTAGAWILRNLFGKQKLGVEASE